MLSASGNPCRVTFFSYSTIHCRIHKIFTLYTGNLEIVKQLIMHGADRKLLNKNSRTAENLAREKGYTEVADYLKNL